MVCSVTCYCVLYLVLGLKETSCLVSHSKKFLTNHGLVVGYFTTVTDDISYQGRLELKRKMYCIFRGRSLGIEKLTFMDEIGPGRKYCQWQWRYPNYCVVQSFSSFLPSWILSHKWVYYSNKKILKTLSLVCYIINSIIILMSAS